MSPWRPARSVHDPGKTVLNLAVTIALGGDCLADAAVIRAQPELFGAVASDPTISRFIDTLGEDSAAVITAIRGARAAARATLWGHRSPVPRADQVIIDLDATLITAHSEKEGATPNFKHGFGFHPLLAFVDHGDGGTGEPLVGMLRPGRANANTAADQIAVLDAALAQLPEPLRSRVLVRGDSGSGVQPLLWHVHDLGLAYSVGFSARQPVQDALAALPKQAWRAARDPDGLPRDGAQVAELTRWMPPTLTGWPPGMRIIARRERPHPGAQLHITDDDGWRITVFATNTVGADLCEHRKGVGRRHLHAASVLVVDKRLLDGHERRLSGDVDQCLIQVGLCIGRHTRVFRCCDVGDCGRRYLPQKHSSRRPKRPAR